MKHFYYCLAVLWVAVAQANVYIPKAKLAGESVCVRLSKDSASVTAVFDFADAWTKDDKVIYFPIFASKGEIPVEVLARAKFEVTVGPRVFAAAVPCEAPQKTEGLPGDINVCWFKLNVDEQISDVAEYSDGRLPVRLTYTQPLIRSRFYYLPIIPRGDDRTGDGGRDWRFQLFVPFGSKLRRVLSKDSDFEKTDDTIIVYLRDGKVIEVE